MRLFVALELDERAKALLAECQKALGQFDSIVKWVRPEQIHLTLKFLGEVSEGQLQSICNALESLAIHPPVTFTVSGLGWFGSPASPRVVWAGVQEPTGRLESLQKACEVRLAELGFRPEDRPFSPHLTIGRVKRSGPLAKQMTRRIEQLAAEGVGPLQQTCHEVVLFESRLFRSGPQYTRVHAVMLRGS